MESLLTQFAEPEKTAYLAAIASLASADRVASEQETDFLRTLAQTAQLSPQATEQVLAAAQDSTNASIQQHLDVLKGSDLRYSLVADVISFAKADGQYSADEQAMLEKMAAYLGVNQQQVGALGQAVEQVQDQPAATSPDALANNLSGGGLGDMLRRVGIPTGALAQGLLGILAPILISRVLGSRSNAGATSGGSGGLLGALGGLLGGGVLGGSQPIPRASQGGGGLMDMAASVLGGGGQMGSRPNLGGGLGSLMGVLGGLGGRSGYGGLGSVLGQIMK